MKTFSQFKNYLFPVFLIMNLSTVFAEPEEIITTEQFNASSLRLENINMNVEIKTYSDDGIKMKVITPESLENFISFNVSGGELIINQTNTVSVGNISVITHGSKGNGRSVVSIGKQITIVEGNHVVVTHAGNQVRPRMELSVPVGTSLALNNFKGKAKIGNTEGALEMNGSGKVVAGNLGEVVLDVGKNSKIEIDQVKRLLKVNASGNSKLNLHQGNVEKLQASLTGNSKVKYGGHAEKASLSVTDNGKLFIASVTERQVSDLSRNGRLTIGNW